MENANFLQRIATYSAWAANDADTVLFNVKMIRSRPPFETGAEDILRRAKDRLEMALRDVTEAVAEFDSKPTAQ